MWTKLENLFLRIKTSRDGRTLILNFGYLSILQIVSYIFPLITMPYLARVIGVAGFGQVTFGAAIAGWLMTIVDWGFTSTATRDVARCRDNIQQVSKIYSDVLWARLFLMFVSFAFLCGFVFLIPKFYESRRIIFASVLSIPGYILFPDWLFQALERMKFTTLFNLTIKFVFTCLVFLFINDQEDYVWQPILQAFGYIVVGIVAQYIILCRWKIKILKPSFGCIFQSIKGACNVFLGNVVPSTYENALIVFLGMKWGEFANGILTAGTKFLNITLNFVRVLSRTFFPFLSRRLEMHYVFARISLLLSLFLTLLLIVFAPLLIEVFFGNGFNEAVLIHRICSCSLFFQTLINIYGTNYLIVSGNDKVYRNIIVLGSILGCIVGYLSIIVFGVIGAAISIVFVNAFVGVASYLKTKQIAGRV